jgi:alpha-1,3-rhamnosyltransferase
MPLVSIIVITYNSSKYVLETLESTKAQTYQNIELIISDDASQDDTVEICKKWLAENQEKFVRAELITTEINTGIPANCNRGVKASKGEWVKLIAGDDLLLADCIVNGIQFAVQNLDAKIFASNAHFFTNNLSEIIKKTYLKNNEFFDKKLTAKDQFNLLLHRNYINAPTLFFNRSLFDMNNGFDEGIKYMEDYPFYLKTLKKGIKIYYLNKFTVGYRLHASSISGFEEKTIFNTFYKRFFSYQKKYTFQYMNIFEKCFHRHYFYTNSFFEYCRMNKKKYSKFYNIAQKTNIFRYFINK